MIEENKQKQEIRSNLLQFRKMKIMIYGTGVIAKRIITCISDFNIAGVIDGLHFGGEVEGIPVRLWDEIKPGEVDVILIAALQRNYKDIYSRIIDRCLAYGIRIYSERGEDLISYYGHNPSFFDDAKYYRKNEKELKQLIEQYDAISFDLFDTLVMRKVLEPTDVFDIVEQQARKRGILLPQFKILRREAELQAGGSDIYHIYERLGNQTGLTEEEKEAVLEIELACEKSVLVPRIKMVEMLEYAQSLGKRTNIISDMYLNAGILDGLLNEMGIRGYDKIYVSCDYGVSKGSGLFEEYLKDVKGLKCLHIGDNRGSDLQAPLKYGIDSYGIKSAYDMLKISNFRYILPWISNYNEKSLLGLILSKLFNNPYALYGTAGIIQIDNFEMLSTLFAAPAAVMFMLELFTFLQENPGYEKVVFSARDGYLFDKLYKEIKEKSGDKKKMLDSVYLLASRKLCLRAAMGIDMRVLTENITGKKPEAVLVDILGVPKDKLKPFDLEKHQDAIGYCLAHKEILDEKSKITRQRYMKYLLDCGLKLDGKYLFCDLVSKGTVQFALNYIFQEPLDGFYVYRLISGKPYPIKVTDAYQKEYAWLESPLIKHYFYLETVFTSAEPSIEDMDENNRPTFSIETRKKEEIAIIQREQNAIEDFFLDYYENLWIEGERLKRLPELLMGMYNEVEYIGECSCAKEIKLYDDMDGVYYKTVKE